LRRSLRGVAARGERMMEQSCCGRMRNGICEELLFAAKTVLF